MSIGVAIIGGGIFAREQHLPAVNASSHLTLKAVYSRSLKSAQSLETDPSKVDLYSDDSGPGKSYDDLLARSDVHGVIIALPIANQPAYIRAALSAGKHVLSEKPIAENVKDAEELVAWYRANVDASKVTWGVAENFRFLNSFRRAGEIAARLGRVLSFRMRMGALVKGGKYYETEWRKTPTHQGGFVLDAGVHFLAGLRCLLGRDPANRITHLSAFSTQNQPHLPPLDTVDACLRTKGGGTGVVSVSFGTTLGGSEYAAGFERGSVSVVPGMASKMVHGKAVERNVGVVSWREVGQGEGKEGTEEKEEVEDEGTGVMPEVRAWGEGLAKGQLDERQGVEEALADLEILECIFRSGEAAGKPVECRLQV